MLARAVKQLASYHGSYRSPFQSSNVRSLALAVKYKEHGAAEKVYKLETLDEATASKRPEANEVLLKFLVAPINPSDINLANGTYGIKPPLPAIGGNEGVAEVIQTGPGVKGLQKGDWVLPAKAPFGTWRQVAVAAENELIKVPNDIPAAYAGTLAVNPGTAYRMLTDFVDLKPGDYIIQNGANSMVGLAVIQLARERGIKTINIVRSDRPDVDVTMRLLQNLGGDIVLTDTLLTDPFFSESRKELPPIKLALNCVGGEVATDLCRMLAPGGTMVTYGGMAKQPLSVPQDLLTEKQLNLKGFWISKWYDEHSLEERSKMLHELAALVREQKLTFFFEVVDFDDFAWALQKSVEPFRLRKILLNLDYPDRMAEHDARPESDYEVFDAPPY